MARTTARNTPAKKTPARKTAAKKTTTSRKTAAKTTPAKKTTEPRLSVVQPAPEQPRLAIVQDPSRDLPTRPRPFMTDTQGYATLAARIAGIPTHRIKDWRDHHDGTATRPIHDDATLHYDHNTRTLTLQALCPMGAIHKYRLDSPSSATAARIAVDRCNTPHTDLTQQKPLTRDEWAAHGIHTGPTWARPDLLDETPTETIPVPLPTHDKDEPEPRALADQLTHSDTGTADTQPMSHQQIAAYIAEHTDAAKEHPQP